MAISPMKKIALIAPRGLLEPLLEAVQQLEHLQVSAMSPSEAELTDEQPLIQQFDAKHQVPLTNEEALQYLVKRHHRIERAIHQHEAYQPKVSLWHKLTAKQPTVSFDELQQHGAQFDEYKVVDRTNKLTKRLQRIQEKIEDIKLEQEALRKWRNLEITPKMARDFEVVKLIIGTVPSTQEDPFIKFIKQHDELEHDILFVTDTEYGVLVFLKDLENDDLLLELKAYQFVPFEYEHEILPKVRFEYLQEQQAQLEQERQGIIEELSQAQQLSDALRLQADYVQNLQAREQAKLLTGRTTHLIAIEGWIEEVNVESFVMRVQSEFQDQVVIRQFDVMDEELSKVPIKLNNHPLIEPFEVVTQMFALPKYNELDPTPFLMPFYLTFFGMMVADLGYGIFLALVTWLAMTFFNVSDTMSKNLRLFHLIGWSTAVWGIIYGSFFGFSLSFKLIDMNQDVTTILVLSVIFGFIQLIVAFLLNSYLQYRRKAYIESYVSGLAWVMILIGIALYIVGTVFPQYAIIGSVGKWLAILNAVGIIIASIVDAKSPIGIGIGLYNLYGMSGYVGDLVSYSRLMALGLSGGSIAVAFNMIVAVLPPIARFSIGIVLFVALHALNFALGMLGGYVHGARLMFVEFFGKFYEGGGKPFKPLNVSGKYTKVKTKHHLEGK